MAIGSRVWKIRAHIATRLAPSGIKHIARSTFAKKRLLSPNIR